MSDVLQFRDHNDIGAITGSMYAALADAARANPDRYDGEKMRLALNYLWNYTFNPILREIESGDRLMVPDVCPVNENGWYDFEAKENRDG